MVGTVGSKAGGWDANGGLRFSGRQRMTEDWASEGSQAGSDDRTRPTQQQPHNSGAENNFLELSLKPQGDLIL